MDLPLHLFFATVIAFGAWIGIEILRERRRERRSRDARALEAEIGLRAVDPDDVEEGEGRARAYDLARSFRVPPGGTRRIERVFEGRDGEVAIEVFFHSLRIGSSWRMNYYRSETVVALRIPHLALPTFHLNSLRWWMPRQAVRYVGSHVRVLAPRTSSHRFLLTLASAEVPETFLPESILLECEQHGLCLQGGGERVFVYRPQEVLGGPALVERLEVGRRIARALCDG